MRPIRRLLSAALALAALLSFTSSGHAEERALAVLGVDVGGSSPVDPAALRDQVTATLLQALSASGYAVADPTRVGKVLARNQALAGCYAQDCLTTLADLLKVERFLHVRIDAFGQSFAVAMDLYATNQPQALLAHVEKKCNVCTMGELDASVAQTVQMIHDRDIAAPPGGTVAAGPQPVTVRSTPSGALVKIDGHPVAPGETTPLTVPLAPGSHAIEADLAGYLPAESSLTVDAAPQTVTLALVAGETGTIAPPDRPFRSWKWVAAGSAAALLGTGIVLVAINGKGTCGGPGSCPNLYDTSSTGYATIALGLAAAVGAGALFVVDDDEPAGAAPARSASLVPLPGGAAASMTLRF